MMHTVGIDKQPGRRKSNQLARAAGALPKGRKSTASVLEMGSYDTYITGLIYFRNALEALIESWPKGEDEMPKSIASCPQEENTRFLLTLSSLIDGYEQAVAAYFKTPTAALASPDLPAEARPAGLPRIAGGSRLERDLLAQIIRLLADLMRLKMFIRGPLH